MECSRDSIHDLFEFIHRYDLIIIQKIGPTKFGSKMLQSFKGFHRGETHFFFFFKLMYVLITFGDVDPSVSNRLFGKLSNLLDVEERNNAKMYVRRSWKLKDKIFLGVVEII